MNINFNLLPPNEVKQEMVIYLNEYVTLTNFEQDRFEKLLIHAVLDSR